MASTLPSYFKNLSLLSAQAKRATANTSTSSQAPGIDVQQLLTMHTATQQQTQQLLSAIGKHTSTVGQLAANSAQPAQSAHGSVKLPVLTIRKFDGDILHFTEFIDMFQSAIGTNQSLSAVQKLSYLRSHLTGMALDVIAGIPTTDSNYPVALGLLKDRFGKKDAIIAARYRAITEMPAPSNKPHMLRRFYNEVEANLRCLQAEGQSVQQELLIPVITSKLPKCVIVQLETQKPHNQSWTVDELRKQLGIYLEVRESAERLAGDTASKPESTLPRPPPVSAQPHAAYSQPPATAATLVSSVRRATPRCFFCKLQHFSDTCPTFNTVSTRQQQLQDHCFVCLRKGHWAKDCTARRPCYHCNLLTHHRALCPQKFGSSPVSAAASTFYPTQQQQGPQKHTTATVHVQSKGVNLPTAIATVAGQGNISDCRLLFDTGSTRTFIHESLAASVNAAVVGEDVLSIASFGSASRRTVTLPRVEFSLLCRDGSALPVTANVMPWICCPVVKSPIDIDQYPEVKNIQLADTIVTKREEVEIDLLIGTDFYFSIMGNGHIQLNNGLVLLNSKLGFVPAGPTDTETDDTAGHIMLTDATTLPDPVFDLQRFWRLEDIGITDDISDPQTADDIALEHFRSSLQLINGRYMVSWPWKDSHTPQPNLPENYELAFGRLKSLVKRLQQTPQVLEKYHCTITEQLANGIIEEVNLDHQDGPIHYIPHHCVVRPSSTTTKVRVVYDASARTRAEHNSLNDCLHRGPILLPDLCGILVRFRLHPIGIVSDVEKAFLQLGLSMTDRNVTRFLWLRDPTKPVTTANLVIYRFCRVPFGIVASPFLLAATVDHHLQQQQTGTCDDVRRSIYVDNVVTGQSSVQDATAYYREAKDAFASATMNLREWGTNDPDFRDALAPEDKSSCDVMKVLGMSWDTNRDTLSTAKSTTNQYSVITKRDVLRSIAQFYDPMGLFSPVIMRAKILVQSIWKLHVDWDSPLPDALVHEWKDILSDLSCASDVAIPRFIGPKIHVDKVTYELHVFCDASQDGYGAAAYLCVRQVDGAYSSVDLIYSRTRVSPIKATSIPRLELLAALIGARIIKFLKKELLGAVHISATHLWSDSQCVLGWIKNTEKSYPVFIANRLKEIRADQSVCFNYIRTADNPADLPSRGASLATLTDSTAWWCGPEWLRDPPVHWPKDVIDAPSTVLFAAEGPAETETSSKPSPLSIDESKYTSFEKLARVTAYGIKFVKRCRQQTTCGTHLSAAEIDNAKHLWIQHVQATHYTPEIEAIKSNAKNKLVQNLALFLDEHNLIRCKGRLENSSLPYSAKYPILLPRSHPVTTAIINDCHRMVLHSGTNHTLSRVRYDYWVPRGRQTVKTVLKKCGVCKRFNGRPYSLPKMAPYPPERVAESKPFTHVGVDYFGPMTVREHGLIHKVWVCLFTCMVTRAIHLELVADMTTEQFLMALRRFVARRGVPRKIFSDNAQQFLLSKSTLQLAWEAIVKDDHTLNYAASHGIEWICIVQLSPWMGGFYERLIGIVKKALRKSIGRLVLGTTELSTILVEVEAVVNSRPLVYVSDEIYTVLTPAHFLSLSAEISLPQGHVEEDPDFAPTMSSAELLLSTWKKGQKRLNEFWNCWRSEYLTSLRERQQSQLKQVAHSTVKPRIGHVCLIKDDAPRGMWKLGIISELHASRDGETRSATVRTPNNKLLRRSLQHLYPLECESARPADHSSNEPQPPAVTNDAHVPATASRPVRRAAIEGLGRVLDLHEADLV
ncbi:uncharacterized protein LOC135829305 [Sycon ciliatum]|uniref:uncharacterized protein LOC135829305 n=1 Tax=Sycon ciliatum TaxID=27933 RepID=UPI0031F6B452